MTTNDANTGLWRSPGGIVFVSKELIDEIKGFPVKRDVEHCGVRFSVPSIDIYCRCPSCGVEMKLRSWSGNYEFEEVFIAVLEWLYRPGASEVFEKWKTIVHSELTDEAHAAER